MKVRLNLATNALQTHRKFLAVSGLIGAFAVIVFLALEKILPTGVRLVSIDPAHEKGQVQVRLSVGAISDEAKLKFFRALENSPAFKDFRELNESPSEPQQGSGGVDRLQIQLTVVYA